MVVSQNISDIDKLDLTRAVLVSPSDTILGFHALFSSTEAIKKIKRLKNREENFIVLVSNLDEAKTLCEFTPKQLSLVRQYWPGSVTFVLNRLDHEGTLALRLPKNAYVLKMIQHFGGPIVSTSCNRHGKAPLKTLSEAQREFGGELDLYLDLPVPPQTGPSTLVDLSREPYRILRLGAVVVTV